MCIDALSCTTMVFFPLYFCGLGTPGALAFLKSQQSAAESFTLVEY